MKTAEPIKIHVAICEQGYSCFAAWCFKPAVLEIQRGARPPVQYCARDLVTHLRHLPEGTRSSTPTRQGCCWRRVVRK
jgi:hypothetical protein